MEVKGNTIIPDNMASTFLPDEQNKIAWNNLIVKNCQNPSASTWKKQFCVTNGLNYVQTDVGIRYIYTPDMLNVLEEADNRIVCHIKDMLESGISRISVKTVDSDVVVILLSFVSTFFDINTNLELYIDFNTGTNRRNISIHTCYQLLGKNVC